MSKSDQSSHPEGSSRSEGWPERMSLSLAHKFLRVSHTKLTSLVKTGVIPHERDPLDHRVKLVKKADLEKLMRTREVSSKTQNR